MDGEVKTTDIGTDAVTADEIAGVGKLIYATCNVDIATAASPIPSSANGGNAEVACPVPGAATTDTAIVTSSPLCEIQIVINPVTAPYCLFVAGATASADEVSIIVINPTNRNINPPPSTFSISVFTP